MKTAKNKQIFSIVYYELIFSKLSPDLPCIPHPVIVTKRKLISPLWHCQQGGKQPAAFRRIPAPWCAHWCRGFYRWRTEDRRPACFSAVSGWTSLASAWRIGTWCCSCSGVHGEGAGMSTPVVSAFGQVRQQPWCWSQEKQGAEGEGRGKRGTLGVAWRAVNSKLSCEQRRQ